MIINNYEKEPIIKFEFKFFDSFILWKTRKFVSAFITDEKYLNYKKWILKHFEYEIMKAHTNERLSDEYDKGIERMFSSIEIEVINRCNGDCAFCPLNKKIDPRKMTKMKPELFYKIIDELGTIEYRGRLALHSNNEPFLDDRIVEFAEYARTHVPNAYIYMYTNGTLLTEEKFNKIITFLDLIVIDNYDDKLELHEKAKRISELCQKDKVLDNKVKIYIRKKNEVLNTRGGQSPNNKKKRIYDMSCILPFSQMVIRPDGKVSLCCNDPYGKYTLADVNDTSLVDAWKSEEYVRLRKAIRKGRKNVDLCKYCDTMPDPKVY